MMNAPLMTEPTAWLVKRYPRWEGFRCNSFKPNTGINEGIMAMKNENSVCRIRRILIPGV